LELTRARLLEFVREPGALFWVFGFPVLLAVALGIAFRAQPPEAVRVAVVEGPESAWMVAALEADDGVEPVLVSSTEEATELARRGEVALGLAPEGNGDGAARGYSVVLDPTRPDAASARLRVDDLLQRSLGRRDVAQVREVPIEEPGGRYIDFLLPGLIGLNLMGSSMWGVGFAVVQMRVHKLLKRFAATPMHRSDYLLSLMLSRLVFLTGELLALLAVGVWVFGVEIQGSWFAVLVVSLVGTLAFTGLALLTAARPETVEVASGWMNLIMLPMWLVSGTFFSYSRFPEFLQPVIRALPLTALNDALRAIINQGATLASTSPQLLILAAWGVAAFAGALAIFKWQ
jgi:ABC-type multidrug transport system permease subunit